MEFVLAGALVLHAIVYIAGARTQSRSLHSIIGSVRDASAAISTAADAARNGHGTETARVADIEARLNTLVRDLNDIDERSEARYRRLTARERRADADNDSARDNGESIRAPFQLTGPREGPNTSAGTPRRRLIKRA